MIVPNGQMEDRHKNASIKIMIRYFKPEGKSEYCLYMFKYYRNKSSFCWHIKISGYSPKTVFNHTFVSLNVIIYFCDRLNAKFIEKI